MNDEETRYRFECECNGEIPIGEKKPRGRGKERTMDHKARQYSDQMHCHVCGKQWDVNDPYPPKCITENERKKARSLQQVGKLRRQLRHR